MFNRDHIARLYAGAAIVAIIIALSPQSSPQPWPGKDDARVVDHSATFEENLSGLAFEKFADGNAALWGVQNRPESAWDAVPSQE